MDKNKLELKHESDTTDNLNKEIESITKRHEYLGKLEFITFILSVIGDAVLIIAIIKSFQDNTISKETFNIIFSISMIIDIIWGILAIYNIRTGKKITILLEIYDNKRQRLNEYNNIKNEKDLKKYLDNKDKDNKEEKGTSKNE